MRMAASCRQTTCPSSGTTSRFTFDFVKLRWEALFWADIASGLVVLAMCNSNFP